MKKILTLPMMFVGVLILLAPNATRAQEQVASLTRGNGTSAEAKGAPRISTQAYLARMSGLQKRRAALQKYLASVDPASADYKVTQLSLQKIKDDLQVLAQGAVNSGSRAVFAAEKAAPATPLAPPGEASGNAASFTPPARQTGKIKLELVDKTDGGSIAEVRVTLDPSVTSGYKIEVKDSKGKQVGNVITRTPSEMTFGLFKYREYLTLADGTNTIQATSNDGNESSDPLTVEGGRPAADEGSFGNRGGVVGYSLGGMVVSQQAQNFNQADPFFGFVAGYDSGDHGAKDGPGAWRWHLRFQGIFTASGRTAQGTDTAEGSNGETPNPAPTPDPFKFIASRKTFDVDAHLWVDFWAKNSFSIGPYIAWGASTVMDKNELSGEAVIKDEDEDGEPDNNQVVTESESDNDLKQFREYGLLMNMRFGSRDNSPLFIQAILAKGWYEALKDLDGTDDDTRNRFVGKLRVFPEGLGFMNKAVTPMFGVEMNAGTGPDQVKFFTGFAVRLKGLNIGGK